MISSWTTKEEYISYHETENAKRAQDFEDAKARDEARFWAKKRAERNQKLKDSDWTQGADIPDSIKTPYATYRQELRDLPTTDFKAENKTAFWPTEPSI